MARPTKGDEPLSEPLNTKITKTTKARINAIALRRSTPSAMVPPSDVVREALDEGLGVIEKKEKEPKKR